MSVGGRLRRPSSIAHSTSPLVPGSFVVSGTTAMRTSQSSQSLLCVVMSDPSVWRRREQQTAASETDEQRDTANPEAHDRTGACTPAAATCVPFVAFLPTMMVVHACVVAIRIAAATTSSRRRWNDDDDANERRRDGGRERSTISRRSRGENRRGMCCSCARVECVGVCRRGVRACARVTVLRGDTTRPSALNSIWASRARRGPGASHAWSVSTDRNRTRGRRRGV